MYTITIIVDDKLTFAPYFLKGKAYPGNKLVFIKAENENSKLVKV